MQKKVRVRLVWINGKVTDVTGTWYKIKKYINNNLIGIEKHYLVDELTQYLENPHPYWDENKMQNK